MKQVVLATGNSGKINELADLLQNSGLDILSQKALGVSEAEETGLTFVENALLKARHAAASTGLPAIADDSGLSVDALAGAPGIYSARYAGEPTSDSNNIDKLLTAMADIPNEQRQAQFHCVLVYLRHAEAPVPHIFHGCWRGLITRKRQGKAGFGYDPVFYIPELGRTAAELTTEQKHAHSHRGKALTLLVDALRNA